MNLYDNIGDEEEKQSIKMKNKSQKNGRSQEQIFLTQPTAPLVEPPPFNPETPWDDEFAFKPQTTVPNKMTPLQKGVCMAQLQGYEDSNSPCGYNSNPTRSSIPTRRNALWL